MAASKRYTLADMPAKKSAGARFEPASDQSLLVYFGEQITLEANENVRRLLHLLEQEPIPGVDNLHPAYCSLLVKFAALKWRHQREVARAEARGNSRVLWSGVWTGP